MPYAVGAAGAGRLTPVVAALVGFVAAVPLLAGLRVLSRGPSLIRMLPFSGRAALTEHVINPGLLLICFAGGCGAVVARLLDTGPGLGARCGGRAIRTLGGDTMGDLPGA